MKRVISVDLSVQGIKSLQDELAYRQKWLSAKADALAERLARLGVHKAEIYFDAALYDGINDAKVTVKKSGDCNYTVRANGDSVLFIELGTGIHYPNAPLEEYIGADRMEHGSYGTGQGQNDYWFYTGQPGNAGGELAKYHKNTTITHGNPPNMPMYTAVKELEQEFERIVREVFAE